MLVNDISRNVHPILKTYFLFRKVKLSDFFKSAPYNSIHLFMRGKIEREILF